MFGESLAVAAGVLLLSCSRCGSEGTVRRYHSSTAFAAAPPRRHDQRRGFSNLYASSSSWAELEAQLEPAWSAQQPSSIDSALDRAKPTFSTERPTLFRERHGWCPYSERVWLTLELGNIDYDTIRIDNTGHAPRPSYFSGQTPQLRWPDGKIQSESMDLVYELDRRYGCNLQSENTQVRQVVSKFRDIFPSARPSSRAAYLFQYNGEPLWKSTFETTLQQTNELLAKAKDGPFFCGNSLTAADIAWAPFLERYRYQLPCLHLGLEPDNSAVYPNLAGWYKAMDMQVPAYACRIKGDASSWRKVLTMAGFGNAGVPADVGQTMQSRIALEENEACEMDMVKALALWQEYAVLRPFVASSPAAQAALIVTRNRQAILEDLSKRAAAELPSTDVVTLNEALRTMVHLLLENSSVEDLLVDKEESILRQTVLVLTTFLDERMCIPRDMGAMSSACIKKLATELRKVQC